MRLIAITDDRPIDFEALAIMRMLDLGFNRVHIRKPSLGSEYCRNLIQAIRPIYYSKITIHDYPDFALEFGLGGIHLNSRVVMVPNGFSGLISRSCHSIDDAINVIYDYCFLSPVFDSISKSGYRGAYDFKELASALAGSLNNRLVYALGGIDADHLRLVGHLGFGGAALLGAIWKADSLDGVLKNVNMLLQQK